MSQVSGFAARPQVTMRSKPAGWPKHVAWAGNKPQQNSRAGKEAATAPQDGVVVKIIEARAPADRAGKAGPVETGGQIVPPAGADSKAGSATRRPEAAVGPYGPFFDWLFNQR